MLGSGFDTPEERRVVCRTFIFFQICFEVQIFSYLSGNNIKKKFRFVSRDGEKEAKHLADKGTQKMKVHASIFMVKLVQPVAG